MIKTLYSNNSLGQIQQCVWSTCVFMCVFNCDDDATIFFHNKCKFEFWGSFIIFTATKTESHPRHTLTRILVSAVYIREILKV